MANYKLKSGQNAITWFLGNQEKINAAGGLERYVATHPDEFEPSEDVFNAVKNLGAGIINSFIPGSNLGDSNSVARNIGQSIGAIFSPIKGGAAKEITEEKKDKVSTFTDIVSGAQTAAKLFGGLISPAPGNPPPKTAAAPAPATGLVVSVNSDKDPFGLASEPEKSNTPPWLWPVVIVVGAVLLVALIFKR